MAAAGCSLQELFAYGNQLLQHMIKAQFIFRRHNALDDDLLTNNDAGFDSRAAKIDGQGRWSCLHR